MEWFSVKDKIPELINGKWSDNVLMIFESGIMVVGHLAFFPGYPTMYRCEKDHWCWFEESMKGCKPCNVEPTHWMPLPNTA